MLRPLEEDKLNSSQLYTWYTADVHIGVCLRFTYEVAMYKKTQEEFLYNHQLTT